MVREEEQGFESRKFKEVRLQEILPGQARKPGCSPHTACSFAAMAPKPMASAQAPNRGPWTDHVSCCSVHSCALQAILDFSITDESLLESFASEDSASESLWDSAHAGRYSLHATWLGVKGRQDVGGSDVVPLRN